MTACDGCKNGREFDLPFSMAFQPIIDIDRQKPYAFEALARGIAGEGAGTVLSRVTDVNRYAFDQQCRKRAIELASGLRPVSPEALLSINFMPNAVYEPRACIRLTLDVAKRLSFPLDQIIFEFTEGEQMDVSHVTNILRSYKDIGFKTAIDDFGAGYSGLNLLTQIQPDIVKLDMHLIRGIDQNDRKQKIVRHIFAMLTDLGIECICEGVETRQELAVLQDIGIRLVQGYIFGRPSFETYDFDIGPLKLSS
ncbi:EAL domain-containing protein [Oryzifoliimicrobium ureilyticus]|uniref:EAL domain-containing protein n=1 Tax=Oryzifoliimicrobium ureilyticus TaxID=3113724 RepID=UPI00307680B3